MNESSSLTPMMKALGSVQTFQSYLDLWFRLQPLVTIPLVAFKTTADNNAKHKAKSLAINESTLDTTTATTFMEIENDTPFHQN
jgi:hypothetical protein